MTYVIFADDFCRDETGYGLFKIVKETPSRWTFECVAGEHFRCGHVFNYHRTPWLAKWMARNMAVGWIDDPDMFDSVVAAHREMRSAIKSVDGFAENDRKEARELFKQRTHNYRTEAPDEDRMRG